MRKGWFKRAKKKWFKQNVYSWYVRDRESNSHSTLLAWGRRGETDYLKYGRARFVLEQAFDYCYCLGFAEGFWFARRLMFKKGGRSFLFVHYERVQWFD